MFLVSVVKNYMYLELLLRLSYLLNRPGDHEAENAILLASREVAEVSFLKLCFKN